MYATCDENGDHILLFDAIVDHIKNTLNKRDSIISLVKKRQTRYLKKTHKFGVDMPKTVKEAAELDAKNGDTKWMDAILKEITNVRVAFGRVTSKDGLSALILWYVAKTIYWS